MSDKDANSPNRKRRGVSAKTLALLEPRFDAEVISISEIKRDPTRWHGTVFYCVADLFPMTAASGRTPPMFVFKGKHGAPEGAKRLGGGEGVVHELAKLHLASTKRLSLKINERVDGEPVAYFDFDFGSVEIEFPVPVDDTTYWVDLLATLPPESPLAARFGQHIAIEVRDQHAVEFEKREDLRIADLTTIEIQLSRGMHLTFEEAADRKLLADRRQWLGNLFANPVRGMFLHRRDYVDLAERRKNATKAQASIRTTQHSRSANAATAFASDQSSFVPAAPLPPAPSRPLVAEALRPVQAMPFVPSAPKTQPATIPSSPLASMPLRSKFPEPEKSGFFDRMRDWWNSLWAA